MSETMLRVLEFEEALGLVIEHAHAHCSEQPTPGTELVGLLESLGRVLAGPIIADRDQPPFDRATRDGFAVHAKDISSGLRLNIAGQVRAGEIWQGPPMSAGEAIEIMTGAPVPAGTDAVVMIEHVNVVGYQLQGTEGRNLRAGDNIVPRGEEARQGAVVVPANSLIGPAEIALAATSGLSTLRVFTKPAVAIAATGDELVAIDQTPDGHQIRNSNSYALAALIAAAGGSPSRLEVARDTRDQLLDRVAQGRKHDLLLFSGGVSMGKFDLVEEVLVELGAEFIFTGVKMQPGKPVVFGRLPSQEGAGSDCYFFGLPGNPVSTQVTFHCFVEPFLRMMCGEEIAGPRFVQATLSQNAEARTGLTRFLPAHLTSDLKRPSVRLVGWQGSGDQAANARANCYAVLPSRLEDFNAGAVITVLLR